MNCYAGLAKRLVKSCFVEVKPHQVVPIPQLQPLDASKIIKPKSISEDEAWEATLAWAEAKAQERETKKESQTDTDESYESDDSEVGVSIQPVLKKGISLFGDDTEDEDSSGDEDASGSEDDEEEYNPQTAMAGLMRRGTILEEKKAWNISDAVAAAAMWRDEAQAAAEESVAVAKAMEKLAAARPGPAVAAWDAAVIIQAAARGRAVRAWNPFVSVPLASQTDTNGLAFVARFVAREVVVMVARLFGRKISAATLNAEAAKLEADARARRVVGPVMAVVKRVAATIIQARARGRALRAWKAQFTDELAREMSHIWRARYHTRMGMDAVEQQLAEQWMVSPKCVKAWILLGEQRSASADLMRISVVYTTINHNVQYIHYF